MLKQALSLLIAAVVLGLALQPNRASRTSLRIAARGNLPAIDDLDDRPLVGRATAAGAMLHYDLQQHQSRELTCASPSSAILDLVNPRWLAGWHSVPAAPMLDLDTIAWEPGKVAVARPAEAARNDVHAFCSHHTHWVVEGCYASLVRATFDFQPRLIFMNPGQEQCLANCRARPWEPHKYASKEIQDQHLEFLFAWVAEYYTRAGDMSLQAHVGCFASYAGPKDEVTEQPALQPADRNVESWLRSS